MTHVIVRDNDTDGIYRYILLGPSRRARNNVKRPESTIRRAKLFWNGRSQAVRLPKEFRFDGDEVEISREGEVVILTPVAREHFPSAYWTRVDDLAAGDDLEDVEAIGAGLLDPDLPTDAE